MPGRDSSGPMGMGATTGRGFGLCSGYGWAAGPRIRSFGLRFGRGSGIRNRGRQAGFSLNPAFSGFGRRFGTYSEPDPELEKQSLKQAADELNEQLKAVLARLSAMEKPDQS